MGEVGRSKPASSRAGKIMPASLSVGERCARGGAGREAAVTAMRASRGGSERAQAVCVGLAAVLNMFIELSGCGGGTTSFSCVRPESKAMVGQVGQDSRDRRRWAPGLDLHNLSVIRHILTCTIRGRQIGRAP